MSYGNDPTQLRRVGEPWTVLSVTPAGQVHLVRRPGFQARPRRDPLATLGLVDEGIHSRRFCHNRSGSPDHSPNSRGTRHGSGISGTRHL